METASEKAERYVDSDRPIPYVLTGQEPGFDPDEPIPYVLTERFDENGGAQ